MKKALFFLLVALALALASPARAGKPTQQSFFWQVQWGANDGTHWYAEAVSDFNIINRVVRGMSAEDETKTIDQNGVGGTYGLDVTGFYLSQIDAEHAFIVSIWNPIICLPGPEVTVELFPAVVSVNNTTDFTLYATVNNNRWYELLPGERIQKSVGKNGIMYIRTEPSAWGPQCANVQWILGDF